MTPKPIVNLVIQILKINFVGLDWNTKTHIIIKGFDFKIDIYNCLLLRILKNCLIN